MQERFDQRLRAIPASALHAVVLRTAKAESFRGWWEAAAKPTGPMRDRIFAETAAESARAATRLATRAAQAEEAGYAETLRAVYEGYAEMPPGEDVVRALHAGIFRNSPAGRLQAGRYKSAPAESAFVRWGVEEVALRAPGPLLVPGQMETLSAWFASRIGGGEFHPLLVAAAYLLEFLAIRPFAEGNHRTGRLLMNLLLMRCGHTCMPYGSLDRVISADWTAYHLALRRSQASRNLPRPDISRYLVTFLDVLLLQQRAARETLGRVADEAKLSRNQAAVLAIAARDGEVTNRKAAAEVGISRETAKQTLNRLAALGALRRMGFGRATRYRLPDR